MREVTDHLPGGSSSQAGGAGVDERSVRGTWSRALTWTAIVGWVACIGINVGAPLTAAADWSWKAFLVGVVVLLWTGALRRTETGRLPWVLIATGLSAWIWIDLGFTPTLALPIWWSGYPLFASAIVLMVRRRASGQGRAGLLDGLTLTTATGLIVYQWRIEPYIGEISAASLIYTSVNQIGNVGLLGAVLFLVLSPGRRGPVTHLAVVAFTLVPVQDFIFIELPRHLSEVAVNRFGGLVVLCYGLIATVLLRRDRDELFLPAPFKAETIHPARVLFLGLALLTAPLLAVTRGNLDTSERVPLVLGTVVTVALSLSRFVRAVREQARAQELLAHQADHDPLTGLANRRAFTERIRRSLSRAPGRAGRSTVADVTVLYIDLDRFKPINDEYGHAAGDAVLVAVAERLSLAIRAGDVVARLGGDEFAVLCPGLAAENRQQLADRLVAAISEPIDVSGGTVTVGASIGVATEHNAVGGGDADWDDLITRADHAMFDAKRGGRGRAVIVDAGDLETGDPKIGKTDNVLMAGQFG